MSIAENINKLKSEIPPQVTLIAVTKTYPPDVVMQAYKAGHRIFGENKVQEMLEKYELLPKDIEWHLIGHLQTNKVKFISPFVKLIHSVDSMKLLKEIDKEAKKNNRVIDCLLQIHIAQEETKFGLSFSETEQLLASDELQNLHHIRITGLMGMATNTEDANQIRSEFRQLRNEYNKLQTVHSELPTKNSELPTKNSEQPATNNQQLTTLSIGMSSDYKIAIEEGSTMIRVGSLIFGERKSAKAI